jgi:hypothetical protein
VRIQTFAAAAAIFVSAPAWAQTQTWTEYLSAADGFTVTFPGSPTIRSGVFTMADGATYPTHVHTLRQGSLIFSVTVVDIAKAPVEGDAAIDLAARAFAKTGKVRLDIPSRSGNPGTAARRLFGRELNVVHRDGSESMLQIFTYNKRLYIAEGKSLPPDAGDNIADAVRFEEAVAFPADPVPAGGGAPAGPRPPAAPPGPPQPVSVTVKAGDRLTERWRWAPGGSGKVEYCRQLGRGAETCAVADNPREGDHMPATSTPPVISAVQAGHGWMAVGGKAYFCKHTTYRKNAPMEVTCAEAEARGGLPEGTPSSVQAVANGAARLVLQPGNRSFYCRNPFPDPDDKRSQVSLLCQVL